MSDVTRTTRGAPYLRLEGAAAEDIEEESVTLLVICPELLPQTTTGTVGAGISTNTGTLTDRDGNAISTKVTTSNHVVATWSGQSGVRYPPKIRKGEPVEIYKFAGQDKFYWKATGRGRDYRTTDRVVMEIGASDPTKFGSEKTDDNTYTAYLDSVGKKVGMKTSQANGEVMSFSMEADLAKGTFHLTDNGEEPATRMFFDTGKVSGVSCFQVNLPSGAVLKFEGDNAFIKVPKNLQIDAGERIIFNSPITIFNVEKVGAFIVNAANIALNGVKSIVAVTKALGFNAASSVFKGVLVAGDARISNAVKGGAGSGYTPVEVQRPAETPASNPGNSPDTSTSGVPYRTV